MKKFLSPLIICVLLLAGCGNSSPTIPEGFTEDEYELSQKVVETINDYLSTDITEQDALDKLERLGEQLEESDNVTVSTIGTRAINARFEIQEGDYEDLKEYRDKIQAEIE